MLKLSTKAVDRATKIEGVVTHLQIQSNGSRWYNLQPCKLDPETGQPAQTFWVTEDRLVGETIPDPDIPLYILGTQVEHIHTGFKGMATSLIYHINGCVHVEIQPAGTQKSGKPIQANDFDIRSCKGKAIKQMDEQQKAKSQQANPSPMHVTPLRHR